MRRLRSRLTYANDALEMHAVPTTSDSEIQVFGDSNNTFFSFEDSSFGVSGEMVFG